MLTFVTGDIFSQPAAVLVNPVNCVGVMGRGLAAQFRRRYPAVFRAYRQACGAGELRPGRVLLLPTGSNRPRAIAHFPTKRHWRDASHVEDIDAGLRHLATTIRRLRVPSIAVPPLGCGLGGLDWHTVRPLIAARLHGLDCAIAVFEPGPAATPGTHQDRRRSGISIPAG